MTAPNQTHSSDQRPADAVLMFLPFVPLAAWLLLAGGLTYEQRALYQLASWLLRLLYLLAGIASWRWLRGWLAELSWGGFGVYALVASLIAVGLGSRATFLILTLPLLAFVPWLIIMPCLARRGWERAALAALPHAALTLPLFVAALPDSVGLPQETRIVWALTTLLIGGATAAFAYLRPASWRPWLLAVMATGQALNVIGLLVMDYARLSMIVLVLPLWGLGMLILFGPGLLLNAARAAKRQALRRGWQVPAGRTLRNLVHETAAWLETQRAAPLTLSQPHLAAAANGGSSMTTAQPAAAPRPRPAGDGRLLDRLFKASVVLLTVIVLLAIFFSVARAAVYKIRPYERGLHLRGGKFIALERPGWHTQIPFVDTVLIVRVNERLGYIEQIPAMTADDVTMVVSLEYTYRVTDPERFALEVNDPERIVFEFVQGKLRDVINTKHMSDVMHSRAEMNQEVMLALQEKESQYGVQFITVQMQSASPPDEVVDAIKARMVAVERQSQAQAEAEQTKTLADAEYYAAQKKADGDAYRLEKLAEAEATQTLKQAEARRAAIKLILGELEEHPDIAAEYLKLMTVESLSDNSKWILGGTEGSIIDLGLGGQ